ncbi:hypothetical protein GOP47_0008896 [Adiantum capillus-veneris]|uniref:Kinesin motor domain-containing protein n=1 Tax=Adiantum capillus-veneris TaxID=13818 RepID=A0A9D4UZ68_ADICA|nr:hypothetical protein GOP47_0008896 [Adiantum capillus-veneris]
MPPQARPRAVREESPHRKPFSAAPSPRTKYSFPVVNTPVLRRSRHNSENQPPEIAPNVKANSPFSEASMSPALHSNKSTPAKSKHHGSVSLPPRPLPPRASPSTNPARGGNEPQGNAKRKLNLESPSCADVLVGCHPPQDQDNGVKVIIRLRPCNQKEEAEEATQIVEKISLDSLSLADQNFTFDHVAGQESSQDAVFEIVGKPLVENCLQGFNSSIFAYGQTGSGKTYTMWGATQDLLAQPPSEDRGLTPRVFECLFQRIKEEENKNTEKQLRYQCRCSFFEIYNEQITDLLEPLQKALQVREDTKTGVYVENLTEEFVSSVSEVFHLMLKGLGNRKIAATSMNLESSRSHTLFTCVIESRCKSMSDGVSSVKTSRMNLVDLAGSERQKLTGAAGDRLREAGNINRSLSQLGNVINILAEISQIGKPRHIPYRDSRLTFLLQESLGGNAKLAMICAISPASSCKSETLSTLRFAQRAKSIQNKAVVNEETEDDVKVLREQIRQLKDELMRMKSNETIAGGAGSYSTTWNARRSYNLLRMSLSRPLTLPHTDTDTDEEMEIDEDGVESVDNVAVPMTKPEDSKMPAPEKEAQENSTGLDSTLKSSSDSVINDLLTASYLAELPKKADGKDDLMEGIIEEVYSKESSGLETLQQSEKQTGSEMGQVEMKEAENCNAEHSRSLDVLGAPALQEQSENIHLVLKTMPTLKESHANEEDAGPEIECRTFEEPVVDKKTISNSNLKSVFLLQSEDGDVCGLAESPLKENSRDERECSVNGIFLHDNKPESYVGLEYTRKEAPFSACLEDDAETGMVSADFDDALPDVHYSGGLPELDQLNNRNDDAQPPVEVGKSLEADREKSCIDKIDHITANAEEELVADNLEQSEGLGQEGPEHAINDAAECKSEKTLEAERALKSPVLSLSPHLAVPDLCAPILSISPRLVDDRSQSFCRSSLPAFMEDPMSKACNLSYEEFEDAEAVMRSQEIEDTIVRTSLVKSNLQASKRLSSPTDRLAASLHRGLQILENHQKKVTSTRMSMARFSFQKPDWDKPNPRRTVSQSVQTSLECLPGDPAELTKTMKVDSMPTEQALGKKNPDCIPVEEPSTPQRSVDIQTHTNMEAILAGALRRERVMEEDLNRKTAEIEQLNRLVRQYKHERECNAVLQQSLEDKIARLESLMDGTLPTDDYLNEEWSSLVNEHKILQERYDHHPEVTLANIRQQCLYEDLEKYKSFIELGERDSLLREVSQLRNHLQYYVEVDTPKPIRQRQRSLTPQANHSSPDNGGAEKVKSSDKVDKVNSQDECLGDSERCHMCEKLTAEWTERENEWMCVLEELRVEVEEYRQLSEKRKHEATGQQRCADEMKDALQMAMEGHARLLDQYAELQEKHIGLLAKHRKIRDGMSTARKKAGKLGFLGGGKWFEAQAAELISVKLEREQERKVAKEQVEGLQAQLRDTADAVQAAGELLVRLKEAEETVLIAQDAAALAAQDAERLYREIDKVKRRHSTEIATLQQRLLEARFQKSTLCPMCVMAERVKFEFTGVDSEEAEAALEAQHLAAEVAHGQPVATSHSSLQMLREELAEESNYDESEDYRMQGLDDLHVSEIDDRWYDEVHKCNF